MPGEVPTKAPPKATSDVVQSLDAAEKVNLLAQALLREFLHRRGFKRTLSTFDVECPRNDKTIASRQLMNDLMKLTKVQERAKRVAAAASANGKRAPSSRANNAGGAKPPTAATVPTFMELICGYRIRKRALRSHQQAGSNQEAPLLLGGAMSDSSDEEQAAADEATRHEESLRQSEATVAQKLSELRAQKETLSAELEKLKAREHKLIKKNKKSGIAGGGKEKKTKKSIEPEEFSPQRSRSRHNDNLGHGGGSDVATKKSKMAVLHESSLLDAALGQVSSLPLSSSHGSSGAAVGRNWTPRGAGSGGSLPLHIPEIGLNGGSSIVAASDLRPPSFVAGEGMHLMGDRLAKEVPAWEAPVSRRSSSQSMLSIPEDDDDEVPSPYRVIGRTPYDHNATRPGILRSDERGADKGKLSPPSTSHTPRGGSPTHPTAGAGFGFHTPQTAQPSNASASASAAHHRTSRRVTIIADP